MFKLMILLFIKNVFTLLVTLVIISFSSFYFTQDYVDVSLKEIDNLTGEQQCPPPQVKSDIVINPNAGMSGDGRGWSCNLYLKSEASKVVGVKNIIYDLTWLVARNSTYAGNTYTFDDVEIWMYEYSGVQFPNTNRPAVETWLSSATTPAGVTNLKKVLNGGRITIQNQTFDCIGFPVSMLDVPYEYSGNNSLVIYVQKKTKQTTANSLGFISFRMNKVDNTIRVLANWEGDNLTPLPNTSKISGTSTLASFARVVFNRNYSGTSVKKFSCDADNGSVFSPCFYSPNCSVSLNNPSFCEGENANLVATPKDIRNSVAPTYKWVILPSGVTDPGNVTSFNITKSGKYQVTMTATNLDGSACTSTKFVDIVVKPKPTIPTFINVIQPTCNASGTAEINNFELAPAAYTFKPSTGISTDGTGKITAASGKYKFVVTKNGCTSDSSALLTMNEVLGKPNAPSKITSSGATTFCDGVFINLTASTIPSGATVNWTKNGSAYGTGASVKVTTSGTYAVSVTVNGCTSSENDTIVTVNPLPLTPSTITNADKNQQFCKSENADISKLKPTTGVVWFDVNGNKKNNPAELLTETSYYAAIQDANGCFTKSSDRIKVDVKIIQNPSSPVIGGPTVFCKADNKSIADLTPKSSPTTEIRWFSNKDLATPIPYTPVTPLTTGQYVPKAYVDGCYSLNTTPITVTIEDPQAPTLPTSKFCENNTLSPRLYDFYPNDNLIRYYQTNTSLVALANKNLVKGLNEKYYVRTVTNNGCISLPTEINIDAYFSSGVSISSTPYDFTSTPLCEIDKLNFDLAEAKFNTLPSGNIFWYQGMNDVLENNLRKDLLISSGSYWIAVKGTDGCFSKKQEVKLKVDAGVKPTLKPIELCNTSSYKVVDLDIANFSNPVGILTWYLAKDGTVSLDKSGPVTNDPNVQYWATYKKTNTECESNEKVKLDINWLNSILNLSIIQLDTIVCSGGNINFKTELTPTTATPVYQWYVNDAKVGANSAFYWSKTLKNKDKISVSVTSKDFCPKMVSTYARVDSLRLSMNVPTMVYLKAPVVNLVGYPSGGVFSGKGITNNKLDPSILGVGNKTVTYSFQNSNNCSGEITQKVVIFDTITNICHVTKYDTVKVNVTDTVSILKVKFKLTTGIKANQETSMRVYPNPTSDILLIEVADEKAMAGYRYKILDAAGKEVYNQPVKSAITEISLKSLGAAGTYFFEVYDEKFQRVVSKKIILD